MGISKMYISKATWTILIKFYVYHWEGERLHKVDKYFDNLPSYLYTVRKLHKPSQLIGDDELPDKLFEVVQVSGLGSLSLLFMPAMRDRREDVNFGADPHCFGIKICGKIKQILTLLVEGSKWHSC